MTHRLPFTGCIYVQCPDGSLQMLCRSSLLTVLDESFLVYDRVCAIHVSRAPFRGSKVVKGERTELGRNRYRFRRGGDVGFVTLCEWAKQFVGDGDFVRLYIRLELTP